MPPKKDPEMHLRKKKIFVDATIRLLETVPFEEISIRKIADQAGFHNSTIYTYFRDADWLISLASIRFFGPYTELLSGLSRESRGELDNFYAIWESYCENAFLHPKLYYNFFFGRYKDDLDELFREYYTMYPDEEKAYSSSIEEMYYGHSLTARCMSILKTLVGNKETRVTEDNIDIINAIVLETLEGFLENVSEGHEVIPGKDDPTEQFLRILHFLISKD